MTDLMKEPMRDVFSDHVAESRATFKTRSRQLVSRIKNHALAPGSSAERFKALEVLKSLAKIGTSSGVAPFPHQCLIGTFHKTGTVLIEKMLRDLSRFAEFEVWNIGRFPEGQDDWLIGFDWWSDFHQYDLDASEYPTVLIIRDPRDVIVSSMKFHSVADEPWLHVPQPELGGRTYQQTLLDMNNDEERFLFELRHQAGATIADMLAARRRLSNSDALFLPLEDLMGDRTLGGFKRLFEHLGIESAYLPLALTAAYEHSVFRPGFRKSGHITSGRSKLWQEILPQSVLDELDETYPRAAEELGYEN